MLRKNSQKRIEFKIFKIMSWNSFCSNKHYHVAVYYQKQHQCSKNPNLILRSFQKQDQEPLPHQVGGNNSAIIIRVSKDYIYGLVMRQIRVNVNLTRWTCLCRNFFDPSKSIFHINFVFLDCELGKNTSFQNNKKGVMRQIRVKMNTIRWTTL